MFPPLFPPQPGKIGVNQGEYYGFPTTTKNPWSVETPRISAGRRDRI